MNTKTKVIIVLVVVVAAFAAGRYSSPEKVKVETKIVTVEKEIEKKKIHKHVTKVTTEKTNPDGSKDKTTTIVDNSNIGDTTTTVEKSNSDQTLEKTYTAAKTTISILGGVNVLNPSQLSCGVHISKPVIGPVSVGIWGLSSGIGGASIGIAF